ncbi:A-kinase anchor protein 9 isoform X3 [Rattus norvegicus]|uniref:A-kinase anchor protein 9 isoform X3 n=1 Tax=Rattus norvegicus TaxID=10116 RepID=UPI000810203E|nr:A-kinase anchor protein 9 isoform X3 [Rattus norvegicus]|eukprot:XP_017447935.1 PREDICTED: A-kinase anchor protein 9 isoform X3 [Rattus norvegicus]
MEDEERQRKLAAGKAKLARFRQRKAQCDGDIPKKQKKKRTPSSKQDSSLHTDQQSAEICSESSQRADSAGSPDSSSAEKAKHGQVFAADPESEISTTADECSSEEEDFSIDDSYSEQGAQSSQTCLQMGENELAEKQHEVEELTQELEEMRASFGTEGLKQLQEFEAAIKQRDGIITQLTANLQQARKEKDDTTIEFLELTEQSQKLQIQFQHLQANETLQNSTLSRTATDLLQAKRQIFTLQQQLQDYQKKEEDVQAQISFLQEKIRMLEMEKDRKVESLNTKEIEEKQAIIEELNTRVIEEERKTAELENKVTTADELLGQLQGQVTEKDQEIKSLKLELVNSQQNERKCSEEIKELMRTVEELQKRNLKDSQLGTGTVRRVEQETQRKLSLLQAELDEMYGKQIVQMKQELMKQHMSQIEELKSQHKRDLENTLKSDASTTVSKEQVNLMSAAISELNVRLQDTHAQKEKLKGELGAALGEKSALQSQFEDLLEEVRFLREQVQKARQTIAEQENRLSDARKSLSTVEDLKAEIVAASESRKELEVKHEAEITNYKIKLEMLEKEKNAVLDRMAESQEAELERLRTQLLFSHEEELSKLKEDLEVEHRINVEKLKDNLGIHYKQQIDGLQNEMNRKMETMQCETDNLITRQNQLILENSKLRDLQEHLVNSKSEEMNLQINELQKEIEILRREEKEKGSLEQEVQGLQLKTEQLERQLKEKGDDLQEKCAQLDAENSVLKDEKKALEDMLKMYTPLDQEDPSTRKSEDPRWQKEVGMLRKENEDLQQQCLHLSEEIEKQKNTFAFAEKNFEVNYQELQREYTCLLKIRDDLEDTLAKQALQYESKLSALEEELHSQRGSPTTPPKGENSGFAANRTFPLEPLEVGEVVEKDTTELMEKLEVTRREKLELSEKVSGLSEQLKQTHGTIDSLSEEVRALKQEKEQLLLRCGELELLTNANGTENASVCPVQRSPYQAGPVMGTVRDSQGPISKVSEDLAEESKPMTEDKIPFKESGREPLLLPTRTKKPSRVTVEPCESEKLQQELYALKAEQFSPCREIESELLLQLFLMLTPVHFKDDLRLQMEAQRLCLFVVYSTHADQVRAYMEKEREEALCSLKDELVSAQQKKIDELHKIHQCQLQHVKVQETGNEPLQVLIERLQKAVSEKCFHISKTLNNVFDECYTPLKCEMNIEEKENSGVYTSQNQSPELREYRYEVQDFQENMQILLGKVTEECSKLLVLQTRLNKINEQQVDGVTFEFAEENVAEVEAGLLSGRSQSGLQGADVSHESKVSEYERQVQELQSLVAAGQLQLKETEANYRAEIQCLQERLQAVSEATVQPSLSMDSVVFKGSGAQKPVYCGSCLREQVDGTAEFSDGFEVRQETNMVKLMEKQYQERLEEEIAKVIVSMSIAFAQQTELSRLSEEKENVIQSEQAHALCSQNEHHLNDITSQCQVGLQTVEATGKNLKEEFKPLSKELGEYRKAVPLSNHDDLDDVLKSEEHGLTISEEIFSKDETFLVRNSSPDEVLVSNMDTSRQLILNEQLEDMRQELVRQYEEHQQATELLRQAHMQQMERQREDQEQLQEEIKRLNQQLTQRSSIDTEHVVSERERVLLEELEALKRLSLAGRKELCCELQHSSTQTQDGNDNQEVEEQTLKDKTLERKPEDIPLDINLSNERYALKKANNRLLKILLDVVKTTSAAEETIGRHVLGILDRSSKSQPATSLLWRSETEASATVCVQEECARAMDESVPSYPGSAIATHDSVWSKVTEEGAELSQRLVRSGFAGPVIDPENEELMLNISSRLQAAVEKLLEAISETSSQLEHAKVTQTELMRESFRQKQEATESLHCLEELRERLQEESRAREQLAVELNKAESVIDGYSDEKTLFERQIQEKTDIIEHLEQELLCTNNRLQELESDQRRMEEERELLSRQREAMRADAGPVEQRPIAAAAGAAPGAEFLQETEKLMKEKLEVQCQAEKVRGDLQKQVKALEIDVEEQVSRFIELEQEKNAELIDLRQQSQALEKQLEKMRKFLDEQAIDREHERDVFQQEIQKLEHQLKAVPRLLPVSEHQTREVEQLTNHLKEKTDKCSELLLSKEQLQRDVQERNEEIEKLECRVRELEQALLATADPFPKVEEQKRPGAVEVDPELSLEVQLQAERDATDRKQKEITNLEEQLEQFREELENKNEEVQELLMQLEIQKKESTTRLQELQQENRLFKEEIEKLGFTMKESDSLSTQDQPMLFGKFAQLIQEKEIEIDRLNEQFIKLQQQLKLTTDNKVIEEQKDQIRDLETQIECLMSEQELMKKQRAEEAEQLNGVIEKLQQELVSTEQKREGARALPEDEESFKHQLDRVTVEKLGLEKQVETTNQELTDLKNVLKEINFKMDHMTQALCNLNKELPNVPKESVHVTVHELGCDKLQPEGASAQDASQPLESQTSLMCLQESTKASQILEIKSLPLQGSGSTKDFELAQCHKQIDTIQEQDQSEIGMLQKKITNLQKILEKFSAALVSWVQMEAAQDRVQLYQEKQTQTVSSAPERTDTQNVNCLAENNLESHVPTLAVRPAELESRVAEVLSDIMSEKHMETVGKNASETEKEVVALQKLLEEAKKRLKEEREQSPRDRERTAQLTHAGGGSGFSGGLETFEAESATSELASYKERAEKLEEDLLVKESYITSLQKDLGQVKDQLTEAKEKLSHYLEKENGTGEQESRRVPIPESPSVEGGGGSGTMERTGKVSSSNQTPQILVRHAGVQIDLQSERSQEELRDTINQFTEKMERIQELHAAEILDMESRHILETESLKKEHSVAIQLLTKECETLKDMTQYLRCKKGSSISDLADSVAYQSREVYSSDSESDWGQSQGFDTATEGREEGETSDLFPKKIKGLVKAVHSEGMQVLSLSNPLCDDGEDRSVQQLSESWLKERQTYLNTISSLKDLISKMQVQRETEVYDSCQSHDSFSDWRGELLLACQRVFIKERSVLLATFQTELTSLSTRDADGVLNSLEQRIQEQGIEYQTAMDCLQKADRRSLLTEIEDLRAQINGRKMTLEREQEIEKPSQELLDCNLQQKQSHVLEMQLELGSLRDRAAELQEQLSSEKMVVAELKSELAQAKLELGTTLKAQHKRLKELEAFRSEIKEKTDEIHFLSDTLAREQKKSLELQWALEKEKAKSGHHEEWEKEELEDLKFSLEDQKRKNTQLNLLLEQQKQLLNESQQKMESQKMLHDAQLSEEQGRNLGLQALLESEQVRVQEMKSTLDKERELYAQLQSRDDGGQPLPVLPSEDLLKELQKQLEEKHTRIVELLSETEKYKLDSLQTRQQMEKDREVHQKTLQTEQEANTQGQKKMQELQSKVEELQRQLQEKRQQVYKLDLEGKRLQGIMQEFQKQELEPEEKRGSRGLVYQNLNEPASWTFTDDRTRNWVLQQKMGETKDTNFTKLIEINGELDHNHDLEVIRQTLQHVASKLQHVAQKACNRLQFETASDDAFIWIQENIDGIILQLQKLTGQPGDEHSLAPPSSSCGSLTESLMRQNTELTRLINQLTEEKNTLRSIVVKLEELNRCHWHTGAGRDCCSRFSFIDPADIEAIIASEKEVWNREKLSLQKALKRAEAKVYKLKAELRNDALLRSLSPDSEHAALQKIYNKYLRASSFRKALIYQKKYLLLLLGGFQECEDATLGVLARMGGHPALKDPKTITSHPKGFTRFRSAVRVSIAISRMKFLVRRWQQVTSTSSININRDGFGLSPGIEKTDPFYHSSGGLELYGEPRHTTYRSRFDLDYPRSPLPLQNRYPGAPDLNSTSMASSQLHQYNPDKSLTDYVTRLEALKRRLGAIQSGSTTQFHFGMRR